MNGRDDTRIVTQSVRPCLAPIDQWRRNSAVLAVDLRKIAWWVVARPILANLVGFPLEQVKTRDQLQERPNSPRSHRVSTYLSFISFPTHLHTHAGVFLQEPKPVPMAACRFGFAGADARLAAGLARQHGYKLPAPVSQ
ncbi:uncharacterized protein PG986_009499 [Apiospora aurea]|uniref:Uncharacterized protein n=1 Tax=Apiospora aurea TaxID=335848 RepID=A0ABR1Q840_9PEZI